MSFSIDCLTPHPPSPSKRLIHSRRFALSERGSRLPHAPAPRSRRQPRVGKPAQGTSSRRGGVIHRSCPQACAWLWGFVGCRHSSCAQRRFETSTLGEHPCRGSRPRPPRTLGPQPPIPRFGRKSGTTIRSVALALPRIPRQTLDGRDSTFFIVMQLERGHVRVARASDRPTFSTVLHRREADLWITRQGMIGHPPLRAVRGGCRIRGRQTASSESMAERKTPRPSVPVRGPACESGPKPGSTACSGWGMSPTTLPRSLRTPAMSWAEPLGLPT